MNVYAPATYTPQMTATRTPRAAEYEVIARVTKRLAAASRLAREDYPGLIAALAENELLWSTLAADVAGPGNGLPQSLRARLFYLFRFTTEHSRRVRNGSASAGVLVDINTAVLRGLRGEGATP